MVEIARQWTGNRELKGAQVWKFALLVLISLHGVLALITWASGGFGSTYSHVSLIFFYGIAAWSLHRIGTGYRVAMRLSDLTMQVGVGLWLTMLAAFAVSLLSGIGIWLMLIAQHIMENRAAFYGRP